MMTTKAGCKNVEALNLDFLTTDPLNSKFAQVSHMLVALSRSCTNLTIDLTSKAYWILLVVGPES